ncbi:MAG: DUF3040 domain-containing protein [Acidimicrobiia bacterium]
MPLDDHEQRILDEIERQFYEEDPDLALAVRNIDRSGRFGVRYPLVGLVVGMVLVLATFTTSTPLALLGFVLMVASATALAYGIRNRIQAGARSVVPPDASSSNWYRRFRRG